MDFGGGGRDMNTTTAGWMVGGREGGRERGEGEGRGGKGREN